jgi:RimJ/RimL family protein N-acetyltransferase
MVGSGNPGGTVGMKVLDTERLRLRWLNADDAAFILDLVNQPSWLRFIGDRNVRNLEDARSYIAKGPAAMYRSNGFGLYMVERRLDGAALGLCGLIKRDGLIDIDIGFAFLPHYWGKGYAVEAAGAVLELGFGQMQLARIVAITAQDNLQSIKLLERIGMHFETMLRLREDDEELKLFAVNRPRSD